jgi:Transposase
VAQPTLWAGIDAGKTAHHCVAINSDGQRVLSMRVINDEDALLDLIRAVNELADGGSVQWAIDLNSGGAALLITLLLHHGQELLYIPGRTVHHASGAYRGEGKTDLLTELSASSPRGCVPGGVRLARFAAREQRCGCAAGVVRAGGAAAGFAGGDGRAVRAVSAC